MRLSITTLSIMTLSIITFSITKKLDLSIMTLNIMTFSIAKVKCDSQHGDTDNDDSLSC
jgi:hypothetical protein